MECGLNLDCRRKGWLLCALAWLALPMASQAATNSTPAPVVPKYSRFDKSFSSTVAYGNPPADATLTVVFTSPQGDTTKVPGFWDGGRTWRVRFSPDLAGKWSFKTACSDAKNSGLNNVTGQFLCTAAVGKSRFELHGPLQVAPDRRHLEHEDKTPFFWLADTVWDGARRSKLADWDYYAQVRASQRFTVAQWSAAPGVNFKNQTAWSGDKHIVINPAFFAQLDSKIELLERVGMVSAIVPLRDIAPPGTNAFEALPEDQAILLLRYMVARWGAYNVVWVLSCEGEGPGGKINRWKRIGREVFDGVRTPVMLYAGGTYWALEEFRGEPWLDMFGYQSGREINDDAIQWLVAGPVSTDWEKEPPRPIINLALPYEKRTGGTVRAAPHAAGHPPHGVLEPAECSSGGRDLWGLLGLELADGQTKGRGPSPVAHGLVHARRQTNGNPRRIFLVGGILAFAPRARHARPATRLGGARTAHCGCAHRVPRSGRHLCSRRPAGLFVSCGHAGGGGEFLDQSAHGRTRAGFRRRERDGNPRV